MDMVLTLAKIVLAAIISIIVGLPLYALPTTLPLSPGPRPDIGDLALSEAARQLQATGMTGVGLVEAARALVAERMHY